MINKNTTILLISIDESRLSPNVEADRSAYALRKCGYNTDIVHFHGVQTANQMMQKIAKDYDVVGVAVRQPAYKGGFNNGSIVVQTIKEKYPNTRTFVMGHFATSNMESIIVECPWFDYILLGDSVDLVLQLVESIEQGTSLASIHIATSKDFLNKKINISNSVYEGTVFDFYENDTLANNAKKTHQIQLKNNVCNGGCTFCEWRSSRVGEFAFREKSIVVKEVRTIREKYGVEHVFISDADLFSPSNDSYFEYLFDIFSEFEKLKIGVAFTCFCRACSIQKNDKAIELLNQMYRGGLTSVFIGVDGGNMEDLRLYGKGTTKEDNINCVSLFRECGIYPMIGFININPYSTLERLTENFYTLREIKCIDPNMYARSFLKIYRGTALYTKLKREGLLHENSGITGVIPYDIIDEKVREIHGFLKDNLAAFIKELPINMDQLSANYYDYIFLVGKSPDYSNTFSQLTEKYFGLLTSFFSIIFVEHNIEKAAEKLDAFKRNMLLITEELIYLNDQFEKKTSGVWGVK